MLFCTTELLDCGNICEFIGHTCVGCMLLPVTKLTQSSSYVLPNNMQTSASQMWPMNSQAQPSSSFVAGSSMQPTQVWPMNSQMLQQSSSYRTTGLW
jgi:hypothetical protein